MLKDLGNAAPQSKPRLANDGVGHARSHAVALPVALSIKSKRLPLDTARAGTSDRQG